MVQEEVAEGRTGDGAVDEVDHVIFCTWSGYES